MASDLSASCSRRTLVCTNGIGEPSDGRWVVEWDVMLDTLTCCARTMAAAAATYVMHTSHFTNTLALTSSLLSRSWDRPILV